VATDPSDRPTDEHDRPPATMPGTPIPRPPDTTPGTPVPGPDPPTMPGAPMPGPESSLWLRPQPTSPSWSQPPAPPAGYLGAPPAYYPYGWTAWAAPEPENGQAIAALILGISGLFFLLTGLGLLFFINLPCSILAWIFGSKGMLRVDVGETRKGRGMAQAGHVLGIVGTLLGALGTAFWILIIVATAASG